MLSPFDWLRRSRSGVELLATLRVLERLNQRVASEPDVGIDASGAASRLADLQLAPPHTGLTGPCLRCWTYAPAQTSRSQAFCPVCQAVLSAAPRLDQKSRQAILIWGAVNQLPQQLRSASYRSDKRMLGAFCRDEQHFLVALYRRALKGWLQDLLLYDGLELRGVLHIFPTLGSAGYRMDEMLCQVVYQETRFGRDRLRVRFFPTAKHLMQVHKFEKQGVVSFDVAEFVNLLESASVFRALLLPEEQETLREVLAVKDPNEAQFYWGRFLGMITPEAKDMLTAWKVRQWSPAQRDLFFQLLEYVAIYRAD